MKPSHQTLLDMYENQRMTTRQMGDVLGVSKTHVLRWLKSYDIAIRSSSNGLAYRGVEAPTAAELEWMVHVEHLSYREIAERYGVDQTAVPYWLTKHGIAKPTVWGTRRKGRAAPTLDLPAIAARYEGGESLKAIAEDYGVSRGTLTVWCRKQGMKIRRDGWNGGHRYVASDGHMLRSVYEQRIDDWLHSQGLAHELEPAYPWDRRYMADFKVGPVYVEVWGVTENPAYKRRKAMKIQRCKEAGLDLVSINHWQFAEGRRWWKPLERLLTPEPPAPELPLPARM